MKSPELEWKPGQILIKLSEGRHSTTALHVAGPPTISKAFDAISKKVGVRNSQTLFPHYNTAAIQSLQHHSSNSKGHKPDSSAMASLGRWMLLEVDPATDITELVKQYSALPEVASAEPNYLFRLVETKVSTKADPARSGGTHIQAAFIPNDPDFGLQWGLTYINAPEAWDIEMGDPSQVIAIIDTGVDLDHPDLASKIWVNSDELPGDGNADACPGICGVDDDGDGLIDEDDNGLQKGIDAGWNADYADDDDENGYIDDFNGWDWVSNGEGFEDNDPQDDNGHGTHVAGIAAAATNNGIGMSGACPLCTIMPLKAFQSSGTAGFSDVAKAIDYAWRNGATVINMSFSSTGDSALVKDALSLAFTTASLVAAAGNSGKERYAPAGDNCSTFIAPSFPAHYTFVLGVEAGIEVPGGDLAGFSNCEYEMRNPGAGIFSTVLNDSYTTWSGTSMAAPMVAGTAGLLRANHIGDPSWGPDLVFGQLINSSGNALSALTAVPQPDLKFIEFIIIDDCPSCDNDGRADNGESVKVVVTVRNLWGNATAVTGTLATIDVLATVTDNTATWGSIGPSAFDDNSDNPFVVNIDPAAGNNRDIIFDVVINPDNGGTGITTQIVLTIQRGIEKSGILSSSETWTANNLYLVTGNLVVMPGVTLTIEPGTHVQIDDGQSMSIRGELNAVGTANNRIEFSGNAGNWWGTLLFQETSVVLDINEDYVSGSILENTIIRNAKGTDTNPYGVSLSNGAAFIHNNLFTDISRAHALGIKSNPETSLIDGNLFTGNTPLPTRGAIFSTSPHAIIRNNTIVGNMNTEARNWGGGIVFDSSNSGPSTLNNNIFSNSLFDFSHRKSYDMDVSNNYWGTTDPSIISRQIYDFFDEPGSGILFYQPSLALPNPDAPVVIANISLNPSSPIAAETVTFTVAFSRPVANTAVDPLVFFGPAEPYTSHPIGLNGTWLDNTTWQGQAKITTFTGDGLQKITVTGVKDLDGFPLPFGDHRFGFEIITAGTSAAQLSATGNVGFIALDWFDNSLPDTAGYNLYRASISGGPYSKINSAIIANSNYDDFDVLPGETNYYIYRTVTTDLLESPNSDETSAAALDTVPPVIDHSPVNSAPAGQALTILATITDNIAVTGSSVYSRPLGSGASYTILSMINAVGDQYSVNIPAEDMFSPGIEYYVEATDGVSITQHGTAIAPHGVTIQDVPVINSVNPVTGNFSGGDSVTITGSNFSNLPVVRFGGTESPAVTFISDTELTAVTPAHYPALVDIEVENPDTTLGRLTNAYTFTGNTATLTLPPAAVGDRLSNVQLAVNTVSVEGMISALISIQFDAAVLTPTSVTAGNLTTGFSVTANTTTPGVIVISMANATPVTGAGDIALISFDVIGAPDAVTALSFAAVEINDGAIPTTLVGGQFTVNNAFNLSGTVTYYQGGAPVPDNQLDITGSGSFTTVTDAAGAYSFNGLPSGNYTLTPSKNDEVSPLIVGPLDASLILQHSSGLITLTGNQATAADVNKAGNISPFDASLILQYSAGLIGLPFPGNLKVWEYVPSLYNYTNLDAHQGNQNFTALVAGDVSGNWVTSALQVPQVNAEKRPLNKKEINAIPVATLQFTEEWGDPGTTVMIPLRIDNADGVLAALSTIRWDQNVLVIQTITTTSYTASFSLATNLSIPGQATISQASASALTGSGELILLTFTVIGIPGETSPLELISVDLNEGSIGTTLIDNQLNVVFPDEIHISNESIGGLKLYQACKKVIVGPDLTIVAGSEVTFRSGSSVSYLGVVNVELSAEMTVEIEPLPFCR